MQTKLTDHDTIHEDTSHTLPDYNAITTPDALIDYCKAYCRKAINDHDIDVDLTLVIDWNVSKRMKRTAAHVNRPNIPGASCGIPIDWDGTIERFDDDKIPEPFDAWNECRIKVSWRAFQMFDEETWQSILRHELIHVEQFQNYGDSNHRTGFKSRARDVDAPVNCDQFTPYKYRIFCKECDEFLTGRHRECKTTRNPESHLSNCCSAPLYVEEQKVPTAD